MDPMTMMAIAQGAKTLFSKKAKQPAYKQQSFNGSYQPQEFNGSYQQAGEADIPQLGQLQGAPQYQQDQQGTETGNSLFQTVVGRQLANYNAGKPILDEPYRNAVLGQAKRSFDLSANESGNQVNEQFNRLNLLGATGHGQAMGEVQRSRLHGLADVEGGLIQQELGQLNNATGQAMSLQQMFQQRGNDKFRNNLAGAEFDRGNATTAFGAGMQRANFGQQERQAGFSNALAGYGANQRERQAAFGNALAGYGANQRERQTAFQGQQQSAESRQNLGTGLIGAGLTAHELYGRKRGSADLVGSMNAARTATGSANRAAGRLGGGGYGGRW